MEFNTKEITSKVQVEDTFATLGIHSNFTCFPQFYAFLKKPTTWLYTVKSVHGTSIILVKAAPILQVRILFKYADTDTSLLKFIQQQFNPQYIAYNLVNECDISEIRSERLEIELDVDTLADLVDPEVKKRFYKAENNNRIVAVPAKVEHMSYILKFLDAWAEMSTKRLGVLCTCSNDRQLLNCFFKTGEVTGILFIDIQTNLVVGIYFGCPHPLSPKYSVSIISKCLRGYTNLGVYMKVIEARSLKNSGFSKLFIGGGEVPDQLRFKKMFLLHGKIHTYYNYEVYNHATINLPDNFLRDIWA